MKKSTVIQTLNELPQRFELDELLERLMVIEKIDEALEDAKSGKTVSHDKVKKMVGVFGRRANRK
jgi:Zn-dependent alcohol dehydrogenase